MTQWLTDSLRCLDANQQLVLNVAEPDYQIVAFVPAGLRRRRTAVASPVMAGDAELASVPDVDAYQVVIRCLGETWGHVQGRHAALVAALTQRWWLLEVGVDGVVETWRANAATEISSPIVPAEVAATPARRVVSATIPVQPGPTVTGSL